ncbi:hypothetical protein GCM10025868_13050 [Angustibacter aerolatus]|uniref:Uncharacterized protein n=1 Tax=Angustibacter aerolatus TaxID=1162965 RepID=A0ABQ6JCZ9_9ACTN|nr:hypothetical protein GCM10025868_13050 [Angustibacter aerolatus]
MWKALDKEAVQQAWVLPTRFGREQRLAGSKVGSASGPDGKVYLWAPYGSWSLRRHVRQEVVCPAG